MSAPLMRMTRRRSVYIKLAGVIILLGVVMAAVFYGQLGPARPGTDEEEFFLIEQGSTPGEIAAGLEKQGLIKNARVFLTYARLTGNIEKFKAGEYLLKPSLNTPQVIAIIIKGRVVAVTFTILEGYHLRQIAEVLAREGIVTEEKFWRLVKDGDFEYPFLKDLPKTERRLEGYLFPDTYTIPKGMAPAKVLDMMLKRFEQIINKMPPNETGLSLHELVTLASIVEGESMLDKERPLVASVFLNRLDIDMKLDSDATIQYLFDKRKERVLLKDLEIKSPYNTYLNKGLPPGPIGSPGEASLKAVFQPDTSKYFYFVARKDNSGEHVFSRTLQEHNVNKRKLGY